MGRLAGWLRFVSTDTREEDTVSQLLLQGGEKLLLFCFITQSVLDTLCSSLKDTVRVMSELVEFCKALLDDVWRIIVSHNY